MTGPADDPARDAPVPADDPAVVDDPASALDPAAPDHDPADDPADDTADDTDDGLLLYAEDGSPWWPVLVGPALALAGGLAENTAPGGAVWGLWIVVGLVVGGVTALVVRARRRFLRVTLTARVLRLGSTALPVADIAAVRPDDGSGAFGIRVLGDGPVVPRKYDPVVLVLVDGTLRAAWAQDGEGLRRALRTLVSTVPDRPDPTP